MKKDNKNVTYSGVSKRTRLIAGILVAALVFGVLVLTISVLIPQAV